MKIPYSIVLFFYNLKLSYSLPSCSDMKSDACSCLVGTKHLEIQCTARWNGAEKRLVLHINEETLEINCYNLEYFSNDLPPKLNLSEISRLEMYNCSTPKDFQQIVNHFSITRLKVLQFENSYRTISLKKEYFQNLEKNLERVKLNLLNFQEIEDNIFYNLSNLIHLEMERNTNFILPANLLKNLKNLRVLVLSQNNLSTIPEGFFENSQNLKSLSLWSNLLKIIKKSTFQYLQNLNTLELSRNQIEIIEKDSFKNLKQLSKINLSENKLKTLPMEIFKYNSQLKLILIEKNKELRAVDFLFSNLKNLEKAALTSSSKLNYLSDHLFTNSTNITILNLQKNNLEGINQNVFKNLSRLIELHLEDNKIYEINGRIFKDLIRLEEIHLQNNFISKLSYDTFHNNPKLKIINLADNNISETNFKVNILEMCPNIKSINLSKNRIRKIDYLIGAKSMLKLEELHLKYNEIEKLKLVNYESDVNLFVNLDYNKINEVVFQGFDEVTFQGKVTFSIKYNRIECDCNSFKLYDFLKKSEFKTYTIVSDSVFCANPEKFKNTKMINLKSEDLSCKLEDKHEPCPFPCSCIWRPYDTSFIINCTNLNLTDFPILKLPTFSQKSFMVNQIEIHLENNNLNRIDENLVGYENVIKLYLSGNKIENVSWLPPKLQLLHLHNNNLNYLSVDILKTMDDLNLTSLTFDENPWKCDCKLTSLLSFLRQHSEMISLKEIKCFNYNKQPLINFSNLDLCEDYLLFYILIPFIIVILFFIICLFLFLTYKQEVKVWLFSKQLCLWLVTEEEVDKDKRYDAFISYSHNDEEFVIGNLLPVLESGSSPYKLCLHFRNWVPGEFIATQIVNSVLNSRRTIVLLSNHFIESVWGKMEFRTAHTQAVIEGRARVIVILYGDIEIEQLNEELKSYLKTNTYIKWGDPYFWNKLKYALPHSKIKLTASEDTCTNIMSCKGDNMKKKFCNGKY